MTNKVLIAGEGGQLSHELFRHVPENTQFKICSRRELDISDNGAVAAVISAFAPDVVINAAAYTAVDKAESESELAYAVNAKGSENLANKCKISNIRLIHVSTDFVFDGTKNLPYLETDKPSPLSVYGASKLAGENAVLNASQNNIVVRTAWVYSSHGNNFVKTMLRLMCEKDELSVVADQIGTPTWAKGLAFWIWSVSGNSDAKGLYHWTDAGVASWYDFAVAIQELAYEKGLLDKMIPLYPITTEEYPTPAKRPVYSVLNKIRAEQATNLKTIHWRKQLSDMLDEIVLST